MATKPILGALAMTLATAFLPSAHAAENTGRSAMQCVSAQREGNDVAFANRCDKQVFVVWCGELKYSKKRCGDGPQGNAFYTHSVNINPGEKSHARGIGDYRYAACEGGIAFGKDEIQDQPDGSFRCVPSRKYR